MNLTDTLKQIYCPNSKCKSKVAARIENLAKYMGVDDWGESTCIEVSHHFNLSSPYQVFLLEEGLSKGYKANIPAYEKKVKAICQ